jgi:Aromatic acid exporter family member 1
VVESHLRNVVRRLRSAGSVARNAKNTFTNATAFHRADVLHIAKTTLAAVLAWAAARWLTNADSAVWMGPATAVIVLQATVYRTLANGIRRVGAVTAGVMIAGLVGRLLGLNAISLILIVPSALLVARWRRIGDRGADIVTTAVLMLSYGASAAHDQYLRDYVVQTAMGAVTGVAVNLLIPPPLHVRRSYSQMRELAEKLAELLRRIADGMRNGFGDSDLRDWQSEVDALDTRLSDTAEAVDRGAESRRFNPRRWRSPVPAPHTYRPWLRAMRLIMPSANSIVRALDHPADDTDQAADASPFISEPFAHAYADLLQLIAEAIAAQGQNPADSDTDARTQVTTCLERAATIHERVTGLVQEGDVSRPGGWAVSGSLLVDAERILSTLTWCADALEEARRTPAHHHLREPH